MANRIVTISIHLICDCEEVGCPIPLAYIDREGSPERIYRNISRSSRERLAWVCSGTDGIITPHDCGWRWEREV